MAQIMLIRAAVMPISVACMPFRAGWNSRREATGSKVAHSMGCIKLMKSVPGWGVMPNICKSRETIAGISSPSSTRQRPISALRLVWGINFSINGSVRQEREKPQKKPNTEKGKWVIGTPCLQANKDERLCTAANVSMPKNQRVWPLGVSKEDWLCRCMVLEPVVRKPAVCRKLLAQLPGKCGKCRCEKKFC